MGRPRKPTGVLDLTGRLAHDPQRFRDRANEPVHNAPLGDPPARLNATLRAIWTEVAGYLVDGVALASDRPAFERMVWLIDQAREGAISNQGGQQLNRLWAAFGMTPGDRSKVSVPPRRQTNEFDDEDEDVQPAGT